MTVLSASTLVSILNAITIGNTRPFAVVLGVGIVVFLVLLLKAAKSRFGEEGKDQDPDDPGSSPRP